MFELSREQLHAAVDEVVRRLRAALSPVAIYLFGSYVYGKPDRHSDLDFLIIVEDSPLSPYQRDAIAYRALRGMPLSIDVQVYTRAEFEGRSSLPVSFERTVRDKGRLVYAAGAA
jgi:predicted nucleotidyltransferase